ncbi:hypothetical protein GCM10011609_38300 [Lentzea pudingi]|uniref:Antitoxin Phd_YefM, type II toxin-antitoxin system n=1 Tax=Lentzea pudingi TaxID=1789439 RepID=A0ABQ2I2A9_9PSEU|nr:hypothetical protein [Lentzea pudingi]GGM96859.1 hypothetical protein GCM10011609_38300 [Lentzea pudingi]
MGIVSEVQWSELQRDPKSVAAIADQHEVRVKRRDGADLMLVRADQHANRHSGAIMAARAMRSVFRQAGPDVVADALKDEFPWIAVLPESDRAEFVREFVQAIQASADLGQWSLLGQAVHEWANTAIVHADPDLHHALSTPIMTKDFDQVPSSENE